MSICVFRNNINNTVQERWQFSYGEGIKSWYITYDKRTFSLEGKLIAVEYNLQCPVVESKDISKDIRFTQLKNPPCPEDVRKEFLEKRVELCAILLSAPLKLV
jgi:hypothetical protein